MSSNCQTSKQASLGSILRFSIAMIMIVINFHYNKIVIHSHCPQIFRCPHQPQYTRSYISHLYDHHFVTFFSTTFILLTHFGHHIVQCPISNPASVNSILRFNSHHFCLCQCLSFFSPDRDKVRPHGSGAESRARTVISKMSRQ